MKIKVKESFEYYVELPDGLSDTQIEKKIWTVKNTVDCVNEMTCPFWDGYPTQDFISNKISWEEV